MSYRRALASSARACVDVQRFDHPALVALGAAGRRGDQPVRGIELGLARAEQRG